MKKRYTPYLRKYAKGISGSTGSKGNALDKLVVLIVSEKYYVSSYKLLRLIIELRGNLRKRRYMSSAREK